MRKLLLLFISLPILSLAQQTYVPDDNFETFLEINGMGNGVFYDDYVTTANISGVTILDVSYNYIADLTGIEDFAALDTLWCLTNQLTSLDVSNNTALTFLSCADNQLTSLDVSNNSVLEVLDCSSNNSLTSLDVSGATALFSLVCHTTELTSLDVSNNTSLSNLNCGMNWTLTSLDVSNNPVLMYLNCYNSLGLTSLDVSNNSILTYLNCNDCLLTCLNLKNGNNINFQYNYYSNSIKFSVNTSKLRKIFNNIVKEYCYNIM